MFLEPYYVSYNGAGSKQKAVENSSKTGFEQDDIEAEMQHREAGMNCSAPRFREMTYAI